MAKSLASYYPPHPQYQALKAKLAEVRKNAQRTEIVRVPDGPILRPDMEDPRVALLRARLDIPGDRSDERYDEAVLAAVMEFQRGAGLAADGLVGPATVRALNGPNRANPVDVIIVNLDRWRWMARDLGRFYSMVNIPGFTIRVVQDQKTVWLTKTVVGRASRQTPIMSDEMKFITVNPTWNVPPGIVANDYLPALHQDPSALDRIGVKIEQNRDGSFRMYQPPGDGNALGRLRFNFPNKFLVYQHDTPDKNLFGRDVRAYSSGCMRVENPPKYAEILLSYALPDQNYTPERIRAMYGPQEHTINFARPVPVHLTYQTAFVDDAGKLQIRDDVYGYDATHIAVLKGRDRAVADVAIHRPRQQIAREELRLPPGFEHRFGFRDRGYGSTSLEDFFRRFFR
jgi:murein L,D-transpeptidase YcbB/YkuD